MGVRQHRQFSGRQGLARAAPGPQMSQRPSQPSQLPTGWGSQVAIMTFKQWAMCHGGAHHVCIHTLCLLICMPRLRFRRRLLAAPDAICMRLHCSALYCSETAGTCLCSLYPNPCCSHQIMEASKRALQAQQPRSARQWVLPWWRHNTGPRLFNGWTEGEMLAWCCELLSWPWSMCMCWTMCKVRCRIGKM